MQKGRKNTVPRKSFTQKEQEMLRENAYTEKVTEYQVCFTAEFKMAFWEAYCSGMKPTEIVRSLGYDPEILGQKRITMISRHVRMEIQKDGEFHTGRKKRDVSAIPNEADLRNQLKELEARIEFLELQMDFVKKTASLRAGTRQVNS